MYQAVTTYNKVGDALEVKFKSQTVREKLLEAEIVAQFPGVKSFARTEQGRDFTVILRGADAENFEREYTAFCASHKKSIWQL